MYVSFHQGETCIMPKFIEVLICYEPQMFRCDETCQYGMTHRMKDYIELDGEV